MDVAAQLPSLQLRNYVSVLEVGGGIAFFLLPLGRSSPINREHMSMGTSTYVKISSFSFLHSFLVFKKNS